MSEQPKKLAAFVMTTPFYRSTTYDTELSISVKLDELLGGYLFVEGGCEDISRGDLIVIEETNISVRNWRNYGSIPAPNYWRAVKE